MCVSNDAGVLTRRDSIGPKKDTLQASSWHAMTVVLVARSRSRPSPGLRGDDVSGHAPLAHFPLPDSLFIHPRKRTRGEALARGEAAPADEGRDEEVGRPRVDKHLQGLEGGSGVRDMTGSSRVTNPLIHQNPSLQQRTCPSKLMSAT